MNIEITQPQKESLGEIYKVVSQRELDLAELRRYKTADAYYGVGYSNDMLKTLAEKAINELRTPTTEVVRTIISGTNRGDQETTLHLWVLFGGLDRNEARTIAKEFRIHNFIPIDWPDTQ